MDINKLVNDTHKSFRQNGGVKHLLTQEEFNQKPDDFRIKMFVFSTLIKGHLQPYWYNFGQYKGDTSTGIKKGNWDLSLQFNPSSRTRNMLFKNSDELYSYLLRLLKKRKPKMYSKFLQRMTSLIN